MKASKGVRVAVRVRLRVRVGVRVVGVRARERPSDVVLFGNIVG